MRITVDEAKCCGAGQCVLIEPRVFDQGDDGIVVLLAAEPPQEQHTGVHEATRACPAAAIHLGEDR